MEPAHDVVWSGKQSLYPVDEAHSHGVSPIYDCAVPLGERPLTTLDWRKTSFADNEGRVLRRGVFTQNRRQIQ